MRPKTVAGQPNASNRSKDSNLNMENAALEIAQQPVAMNDAEVAVAAKQAADEQIAQHLLKPMDKSTNGNQYSGG